MRRIILFGAAAALLFLCLSGAAGAEEAFRLAVPDIAGFQSNPLTVTAPEAGTVTLRVLDETTEYRVIEKEVPAGKSQILWDGLGWNEERLARKDFRIAAVLRGESGREYACEATAHMLPSLQAILFALPSDPAVYPEEQGDWFLEYRLLYTDQLTAEFYDGETGELVWTSSRPAKGGRVNRVSYALLTGKRALEPGGYRVRVYGQQHPANAKEFALEVREGRRPVLPLQVTGDIMPSQTDSEADIWAKMIAPATVIDIRNVAHQRVYAEPNAASRVLGTLHGQSQCLSVLEIQEKWVRVSAWNHERGAPVEGWVPRRVLKVVQPRTEYGLLVDKKAQTLTLFREGKIVDTLLVSTGRMTKGELYQETAAGSFLTDEHMSDYSTNGLKYDFVIRYDGGNLLHQIPYAWNESGKKEMNPGEMYLGTKASHACIRIQEKPGASGLNAYWFWTHLPYHTRVIVLDDPEEREKLETLVTGNTPDLTEGLKQAWQVEPETGDRSVTITFGGDAVLGGRESYYGLAEGLPAFLEREGMTWPFSGLQEIFQADDLTVVNLECVLKADGEGEDLTRPWRFRGQPEYAKALTEGGVDLVNLANNHTVDYGEAGYAATREALEGVVPFCGNGQNTVLEIRGIRFGFGGCRETTYKENPGIIAEDIQELREQGAEYVIYQCHWGTEYAENHNVLQETMARACRRAGADLVIGHHPHVVQGLDRIDGMPVVYSLGNLCFGGTVKLTTYDALLVQAVFSPDSADHPLTLRLIPILTTSSAGKKVNDYRPVPAAEADALRILKKVQRDTPRLLTEWAILDY